MGLERLDTYLVLGCGGHVTDDGFKNCLGVNNPILDLSEVGDWEYDRLILFFENACDLFTRPMYNHNKCSNALNMMYRDYKVIDSAMLLNIQRFVKTHRECGIFIMLVMKEDYDE
jgi:hypothetical protein